MELVFGTNTLSYFLNEVKPNDAFAVENLNYIIDGGRLDDGTFTGVICICDKKDSHQIYGATVEEFIERANQAVGDDLSKLDWEKYKSRQQLKQEIAALRGQCSRFFERLN